MPYTQRQLSPKMTLRNKKKRERARSLVGHQAQSGDVIYSVVGVHEPTGEAVVRAGLRNIKMDPFILTMVD